MAYHGAAKALKFIFGEGHYQFMVVGMLDMMFQLMHLLEPGSACWTPHWPLSCVVEYG